MSEQQSSLYPKMGAYGMAIAIALGAMGAHVIKKKFGAYEVDIWNTATQYLVYHLIPLLILDLIQPVPNKRKIWAGGLFCCGIVLFCGSLYAIALGAPKWFGAITPIGGTAWIVAWVLLGSSIKSSH